MKLLFTALFATLPLGISSAVTLGNPGTGLFLLTGDNNLIAMTDSAPAAFSPPIPLSGVTVGETLVAIDVRPQNQQLYALGINSTLNTFQLYHVSPESGAVVAVGLAQSLTADTGAAVPVAATRYGIDFSPNADRLRVVNSNGLSFRFNPNTGVLIDGNAVNAGTNPDGAVSGLTTTVDEVAYTNNDPFATVTTLYTIDAATNALYIQNPPNNGTQVSKVGVTVAGGPVDFSAVRGFDIAPGVNVITSNLPASGSAYAALDFFGITALYKINLSSGAATYLSVPAGFSITSLAVRTQIPVAVGLNSGADSLVLFRTDTPGTITTLPASAINAGETLTAIDFRPATGQLMGLGVNATANTASLYILDPKSGGATAVGSPGSIAFTTDGVVPIDLPDPATTGYGFDFNPMVDRIRVVVGNGLSFRVNPNTGAPVDGNLGGASAITGTNPDGAINGATTKVSAAAYTNAYPNLTGVTTLYTLDEATNSLFIQNPPNTGTQTNQKTITLNGSPLDFTAANGFDITADGATVATSNALSPGYGWAALTVGGTTRLYRIQLSTGKATLQGQIGIGSALAGFTLACEPGAGFLPMTLPAVIGTIYRIESSENLVDWQPVPVPVKAAQTSVTVPVPLSPAQPKCFWRAVSP